MNTSIQEQLVKQVLADYGLSSIYRSHTVINGFVMLNLQGNVNMDRLIDSRHLRRAAETLGLMEILYGGDLLNVTTSERHLIVVSAEDQYAAELARVHINNAAEDISRLLNDERLQGIAPATALETLRRIIEADDEIGELADTPLDIGASRQERLARARAMRGSRVFPDQQTVRPEHEHKPVPCPVELDSDEPF